MIAAVFIASWRHGQLRVSAAAIVVFVVLVVAIAGAMLDD